MIQADRPIEIGISLDNKAPLVCHIVEGRAFEEGAIANEQGHP